MDEEEEEEEGEGDEEEELDDGFNHSMKFGA